MHYLFLTLRVLIGSIALCAAATGWSAPYSALVANPDNDRILFERNPDELRYPASLTKMMTLYLLFDSLANGELSPNSEFRTSRFAVLRPPSRLGLAIGESLTAEDGILALVTKSANDVATVIAEGLAGSEATFAALMTNKARDLGMNRTVFRNASGLPDPDQVTTARDMYRLGKALYRDFPRYYSYFATPSFSYGGREHENHNHLMETYPGMDGIKTGYVHASGFNLVASAKRQGRRLIGVVFGGPSAMRRDAHMREILDDGFAQLDGAQPSVITAEFDKPELPRSVETDSGQESPEIGYFDDHTAPQTVLVPRRNRHSFMAVGRPSPTRATAAARSAPIAPSRGAHARKPVNVRGRESFRIAALGTANLGQARSSSREMAARRKEKTSPPIAAKSSLRLAHETRAGAAPRGKPASSSPKGHATNRDASKRGRR